MKATEEFTRGRGEQKVMESQLEVNLNMSRKKLLILLARLNAQKSGPHKAEELLLTLGTEEIRHFDVHVSGTVHCHGPRHLNGP